MPYSPYFSQFNLYPIYPPQQYPYSSSITMETQNPMKGVTIEQAPPPPPVALIVLTQETGISGRGKAKMIDYLKLDAPKYKEGDDSFKNVKPVKMIIGYLGASDCRAIQMVDFYLKI
ncbi:hypothetical protein P3X46_021893 [Hevea brasiliensis]|uniref:Uncharacterized protein n=1 Tax=Hevea brasiliensis TaxID=3981 RepID=A0ABQ9LGZ5_HEVBR|nr:hypothetical protein P3X46_021893 [Hevea brasiliensis]